MFNSSAILQIEEYNYPDDKRMSQIFPSPLITPIKRQKLSRTLVTAIEPQLYHLPSK